MAPTRSPEVGSGARYGVLPWDRIPGYQCFGCSPNNEHGLALKMNDMEDGLATSFTFARRHESYPTIAHGGLVGTVLDELMGNLLALRLRRLALTTNIRTKFVAPIRIGRPYRAVARVVRNSGELWQLESEITDEAGNIVAMSTGSYSVMTSEQAAREMGLEEGVLQAFHGHFAVGRSDNREGAGDGSKHGF
jgi:uncharacterized protein (TIGR00369 family)